MHIADGIIAAEIAAAADVVSVGTIYFLGKRIKAADIPKLGMMAAALFVASLIHFPIAGTSIHLGLFGIAGIILGINAFPAIFSALLFQALIFQHGGILSVGLNSLNMGAGALSAWMIWRMKAVPEPLRAFAAGAMAILIPALLMVVEFQLSGYGRRIFFIFYIYALVAVIEGALTLVVINFFRLVKSPILEAYNEKH